jgi:hypothetical protein
MVYLFLHGLFFSGNDDETNVNRKIWSEILKLKPLSPLPVFQGLTILQATYSAAECRSLGIKRWNIYSNMYCLCVTAVFSVLVFAILTYFRKLNFIRLVYRLCSTRAPDVGNRLQLRKDDPVSVGMSRVKPLEGKLSSHLSSMFKFSDWESGNFVCRYSSVLWYTIDFISITQQNILARLLRACVWNVSSVVGRTALGLSQRWTMSLRAAVDFPQVYYFSSREFRIPRPPLSTLCDY